MPKTTFELLPTWAECEQTIAQMGRQGTTPLVRFIYDYENHAPKDEEFRRSLSEVIDEISGIAVVKHYIGTNKK